MSPTAVHNHSTTEIIPFSPPNSPTLFSERDEFRSAIIPYAELVEEPPVARPLPRLAPISGPTQFRVRTLLLVMTGLAVLLGFLRLLPIDTADILIGFAVIFGVAGFGVLCVELSGALRRSASHNFGRHLE